MAPVRVSEGGCRGVPRIVRVDISTLINNPTKARSTVRCIEARNVGDASPRGSPTARAADSDSDSDDEEDDDDDEQGATRGKVLEMRRVGDKTWRKFASQPDAARAFGIGSGSVSKLINKTRKLKGFEAR